MLTFCDVLIAALIGSIVGGIINSFAEHLIHQFVLGHRALRNGKK